MSDTLEESLPAHAPLGPSSAEGWSTCADYVNANRGLPDWTSEPAAEGTAAHVVSDLCLETGLDAEDLLGLPIRVQGYLFSWDDEDASLLQAGIDRLRESADSATFYGEQRVDISPWTLPGQFGTLDRAYIIDDAGDPVVVVEDLKWGRGIPVTPVENKQLMLYALGFWQAIGRHAAPTATRFRLMIDQPRHSGGGGVWHVTLEELLAFGEWIKGRAALTAQPNPGRTASLKGCLWCRRRRVPGPNGGCDTYDAYMVDLLGQTWDDIDMGIMMSTDLALPRALTPERRSYLLLHRDAIKRWLDHLGEETVEDARLGNDTGLVKLVEGDKLPDKWKDKGATAVPVVEQHLGDGGFNKRLKSPKQVVKAAEGNDAASQAIAEHIERGRRKQILVPLADARDPVTTGAEFDDITNEGN